DRYVETEIELRLILVGDRVGTFDENCQVSIGMRRAEMMEHFHPAVTFLHNLNGDRARRGPHLPHERHGRNPTALVTQNSPPEPDHTRSEKCIHRNPARMS